MVEPSPGNLVGKAIGTFKSTGFSLPAMAGPGVKLKMVTNKNAVIVKKTNFSFLFPPYFIDLPPYFIDIGVSK